MYLILKKFLTLQKSFNFDLADPSDLGLVVLGLREPVPPLPERGTTELLLLLQVLQVRMPRSSLLAKLAKLAINIFAIFCKFCKFLAGSFSAVSKRNFATKYAFDSICQALEDVHTSAPLKTQHFLSIQTYLTQQTDQHV